MKKIVKTQFEKILTVLLSLVMFIPLQYSSVITPVFAEEDDDLPSISIEWEDTVYKDGNNYNMTESFDSTNVVRMKVYYDQKEVREEGYKAGELTIMVKGIGAVNRSEKLEAIVGADKQTDEKKSRDWSYTWNRKTDTYTLTNNNDIKANSVFSGYFELVWELKSRDTKNGYLQDDISATLLMPDGETVQSNTLRFSNTTNMDTYRVDIEKREMYSYEGLTDGIDNPDDYIWIKYSLYAIETKNSRGLKSTPEYTVDLDSTNMGSNAIMVAPDLSISKVSGSNASYTVRPISYSSQDYHDVVYVYGAYPKSSYGDKQVTATFTMNGAYYEGTDDGDTSQVQLATDSVRLTLPADFNFSDIPGNIYGYEKDTYYDKFVNDEDTEEKGGDIAGYKIKKGTTERFYLEGSVNISGGNRYSFEMVDDFLYILQNNGKFRQLTADDYNITKLTLPGTSSLKNINNISISSDKYTIKVYAVKNGKTVTRTDDNLVFEGKIRSYSQDVNLPSGTTSFMIYIEDLEESIRSWSIPVYVSFHLDESDISGDNAANLINGQVVNTTFIRWFDEEGNHIFQYGKDNYDENSQSMGLDRKDFETYGSYLDRERDNITFYEGDKSNYKAYTSVSKLTADGSRMSGKLTIGGDSYFEEEEIPDKFSFYSVLPEGLNLNGLDIEEDIWDIMSLQSDKMSSEVLARYCTPEVIKNYKNSGRTYIALHFDFGNYDIPQKFYIYATFNVKISKDKLKKMGGTVNARSVMMIDKEINEYELGKYNDDGKWSDNADLMSDIDRDGITDEHLSYSYDYSTYVYADSSQFQLSKYVQTTYTDDYVQLPDVPEEQYSGNYSYKLSIVNGANLSKNIVITDILENGDNSQWKGTLSSVDLSDAESIGMKGTVWYSEKTSPGKVGGSDWSKTLDPSKAKAIAVDFGTSEMGAGKELNIILNMKSPSDKSLKNKITENGYKASFTTVDRVTGNETLNDNLKSNLVQVKLTAVLRNIIITKTDATSGEKLSDAQFELIDKSTGESFTTGVSNDKGQIIFKNIPDDVDYTLKEITAPVGYEKTDDQTISFDDADIRMTVEDERKTGSISITKTNDVNRYLKVSGATYTLFRQSDNSAVKTATTDANGEAVFQNLEWDDYYVRETAAPAGYSLNTREYKVTIDRNSVDAVQTISTTDPQDAVSLTLYKKQKLVDGMTTNLPLANCIFSFTRKSDGRTIGNYTTDSNGEIYLDDVLSYDTYIIRELNCPKGYERAEQQEVTISPSQKDVEVTFYDQRQGGTIVIYKNDDNGNIQKGIRYQLYDSTKTNILGTYTTDEYGNIEIDNLEWGTYYLKEYEAPDYLIMDNEFHEIVISDKQLTVFERFTNETVKGKVKLIKTNVGGTVRLSGAKYSLYTVDGTLVKDNLVTDSNGEISVDNLSWGSYYFRETKAPNGYGLSEEFIRFSVNASNCLVTQEVTAEDPVDSRTVTLTKTIRADEINFDNGEPTFVFRLTGTDVNGNPHTYYQMIKFDKDYVVSSTDADGNVSKTVTFSELVAGSYTASEMDSQRYKLKEIRDTENGTVNNDTVVFDLEGNKTAKATFVNERYENQDYSDNQDRTNIVKNLAKLTALKITYTGDKEVEAETDVDKTLIKAIAFYDDGTSRELTESEFTTDIDKYPNENGDYQVRVSYTEKGITKSDSYTVTVFGAKAKVIRIDATPKTSDFSVIPGSNITQDILNDNFTYTAVYSDGTTQNINLNSNKPVTVTSPNYPNNYDNNMTEANNYWEQTFEGADAVMVTFSDDSKLESATYDWVQVYDKSGTSVSGKLGGTAIAGQSFTINGNYVKLAMRSDGSVTYKGFSATLTPLYEAPQVDKVLNFTPETAPDEEGQFNVTINWNPEYFGKSLSTTVSMNAKYADPILLNASGQTNSFKAKIPADATSVIFTDTAAPADASVTDMSQEQNMSVVGWSEDTTFYVSSQRPGVKILPYGNSLKYMFYNLTQLAYIDLSNFDTSYVTDMSYMFNRTGYNATTFNLDLRNLNVSSVLNMVSMFDRTGQNATSFELDLSGWNVSSVTTMKYMFEYAGYNATTWSVGDLSNWDVSSVTVMYYMFYETGRTSSTFNLDLSSWDVSSVTNMVDMFYNAGCNATTWSIGDLSGWDVSSVTNMSEMFYSAGCNATTWSIGDLSNWDVSSVTDMSKMFYRAGYKATTWSIGDLSGWDVSSVTTMLYMFRESGYKASTWSVGNLSNWDVSSVTDMSGMFLETGYNATTWSVGNLSNWDVSSVTDMSDMFNAAGKNATTWSLGDLSGWDVSSVTNMLNLFRAAGYNATVWTVGNLSDWDVSSVTQMGGMFQETGYNATTWSVGDLSTKQVTRSDGTVYTAWDVSSVTNMSFMFYNACRVATSWTIGNISNWDVSSVTTMKCMFEYAGHNAATWTIGELSSWDVSSVTDMSYMFDSAGYNTTTFNLDLSNWDVSSVTKMENMFNDAGYKATTWTVGDLSGWEVSSVTSMNSMFQYAGYNATTWNIGDLNTKQVTKSDGTIYTAWDVSSVTDMSRMFSKTGYKAITWSIGDISGWDVSSVVKMSYMFRQAGYNASYTLDLSGWDVTNVTSYTDFNINVESKVIAPTWVN